MFYGASPKIFLKAKPKRNNTTQSESEFDFYKKRYKNFKFRRHNPIGSYISEFYCYK